MKSFKDILIFFGSVLIISNPFFKINVKKYWCLFYYNIDPSARMLFYSSWEGKVARWWTLYPSLLSTSYKKILKIIVEKIFDYDVPCNPGNSV